jgi:hypothetical protein
MNSYEKKLIKDFPNYEVDTLGVVSNKKRGNILKPVIDRSGYKSVVLSGKRFYIHRLVAITFIPNPQGKPYVNHIDYNPNNNCLDNLEWCTREENSKHSNQENKPHDFDPSVVKKSDYGGRRDTIYIRDENWEAWKAMTHKSDWVNNLISRSKAFAEPVEYDPSKATLSLSGDTGPQEFEGPNSIKIGDEEKK